jgi:NAD-dependent SIR2 family protein deacetylase
MDPHAIDQALRLAADAISAADALIIGAGAGMGVDSGLPDFRGPEGFWRAYPPLRSLGVHFEEMANPAWFDKNPQLAWGFYGHRLNLYRGVTPHAGFAALRRWLDRMPLRGFVYTSNVDGQFQRAGFRDEEVVECHGSIHFGQCLTTCHDAIWPTDDVRVSVDESTLLAADPLPACPRCGGLQRPNILMFSDGGWLHQRALDQEERYKAWLRGLPASAKVVVVECGAGTAIPSVRWASKDAMRSHNATLIRVNVREADAPSGSINLPLGAQDALTRIDALLP